MRSATAARGIVRRFSGLCERAVSLVYPPSCIDCGAATGAAHTLCARCWSRLTFIERPFCERLGTPFPYDTGGTLLSPAAIADPPAFARARAAIRYDDHAASLVSRLKYGDRIELALAIGRMTAHAGIELARDADAIVPVPLHRLRLWRRRFNQAAAIGRIVARECNRPFDPFALQRRKATAHQVGLTRAQRRANLQGAFHVAPEARARIAGKRILLVDDVLTTGATANAAARALLRGGASEVDVLVFARVVLES